MSEEQQEKIMFQYVMNYKAYRRKMIAIRATIAGILTIGMAMLCIKWVAIGILLACIAAAFGALSILVALGNERTYTVYDTRVVIKIRSNDYRTSIPIENISAVKVKRAFYEKDLATSTVTLYAKNAKGKNKKYRLWHIFDAQKAVDYLRERIAARGDNENRK